MRPLVLVLDDDQWMRHLLKEVLALEGFLVAESANASHAERLLHTCVPAQSCSILRCQVQVRDWRCSGSAGLCRWSLSAHLPSLCRRMRSRTRYECYRSPSTRTNSCAR